MTAPAKASMDGRRVTTWEQCIVWQLCAGEYPEDVLQAVINAHENEYHTRYMTSPFFKVGEFVICFADSLRT